MKTIIFTILILGIWGTSLHAQSQQDPQNRQISRLDVTTGNGLLSRRRDARPEKGRSPALP
jgi:hypothetical protein